MLGQVIGVATLQAAEGQSLNFAVPAQRIFALRAGDVQTFNALAAETQKNKRAAAERLYSQGVAQLSRDDYARALPFFEKAVEIDAGYPEAWYQAGFCYGFLGKHSDALKASKTAAKLRPEWSAAYVNIGASSFALGQYKEAADAYKTAIRLDDDNADTQYAYGMSLGKLGRTDEEILAYKRTVAINPSHANAIEKLGQGYFKQKRWADAVTAFNQLLIYKPDAKTYGYLGESYIEPGKLDETTSAQTNATAYDPDLESARYNLGKAYIKQGNRDLALVHYEILRNARSDWADRLYVLLNP